MSGWAPEAVRKARREAALKLERDVTEAIKNALAVIEVEGEDEEDLQVLCILKALDREGLTITRKKVRS